MLSVLVKNTFIIMYHYAFDCFLYRLLKINSRDQQPLLRTCKFSLRTMSLLKKTSDSLIMITGVNDT